MTIRMAETFKYWLRVLAVILLVLLMPIGKPRSTYVSVKDQSLKAFMAMDDVSIHGQYFFEPKNWTILGGTLYLRTQTVRSTLLIVTWIDNHEWNAENLRELAEQEPELQIYWPNRNEKNMGISWVGI